MYTRLSSLAPPPPPHPLLLRHSGHWLSKVDFSCDSCMQNKVRVFVRFCPGRQKRTSEVRHAHTASSSFSFINLASGSSRLSVRPASVFWPAEIAISIQNNCQPKPEEVVTWCYVARSWCMCNPRTGYFSDVLNPSSNKSNKQESFINSEEVIQHAGLLSLLILVWWQQ